jgi:hypothetical protein
MLRGWRWKQSETKKGGLIAALLLWVLVIPRREANPEVRSYELELPGSMLRIAPE